MFKDLDSFQFKVFKAAKFVLFVLSIFFATATILALIFSGNDLSGPFFTICFGLALFFNAMKVNSTLLVAKGKKIKLYQVYKHVFCTARSFFIVLSIFSFV